MIIAQMSDSHITVDPNTGVPAHESSTRLAQAVDHLMKIPMRPDVVLMTGDCVHHGFLEEYEHFQDLVSPLTMPVYVIPGNHDHRARMLEVFGTQGNPSLDGFVQYVVEDFPVRLIALDTHIPGRDEGYLGNEKLQWLEARLEEAPTRPTVVFMHHPPVRTGLDVTDHIRLMDGENLEALLARHSQVERLVAGHLHMAITRRFANTVLMTCPATNHTLLPDIALPEQLVVQMQPPACLLHVWEEHTGFTSYTSLIGEYGPVIQVHDGQQWVS